MMTARTALAAALILVAPFRSAQAGLKLDLRLEHASVLQFERLDATLSIENAGQTPLIMEPGSEDSNAELAFLIEKERYEPLPKAVDRPLIDKLTVMPEKSETVTIDLSLWYALGKVGRYIVRAEIKWRGETYRSNAVMVDVVRGLEIASVRKGVSRQEDRERTYTLRYWSRNRTEHLFLCIDDEQAGINYGVFRLGPVIRVKRPLLKVDGMGYVTVIHQSGPDQFTRSGFMSSRAGVIYIGQVQEREDGTPFQVPRVHTRAGASGDSGTNR